MFVDEGVRIALTILYDYLWRRDQPQVISGVSIRPTQTIARRYLAEEKPWSLLASETYSVPQYCVISMLTEHPRPVTIGFFSDLLRCERGSSRQTHDHLRIQQEYVGNRPWGRKRIAEPASLPTMRGTLVSSCSLWRSMSHIRSHVDASASVRR
jgi:hypothetical protein